MPFVFGQGKQFLLPWIAKKKVPTGNVVVAKKKRSEDEEMLAVIMAAVTVMRSVNG